MLIEFLYSYSPLHRGIIGAIGAVFCFLLYWGVMLLVSYVRKRLGKEVDAVEIQGQIERAAEVSKDEKQTLVDEEKVFCRFCGNSIEEDDKYCPYCGKRQLMPTANLTTKKPMSVKACADFLTSICKQIVSFVTVPFNRILQRIHSQQGTHKSKKVFKPVMRIVIISVCILAVGIGILASYQYYYDDYLPRKYTKEAFYNIVDRFNKAQGDRKLDLAVNICRPFYDWRKEYPRAEEGRVNVLLQYEDKSIQDGYCGRACVYIMKEAKKGNGKAQYAYGVILLGGKNSRWLSDTTRAVYWFNEAAKTGYPKAYGEVGVAYEKGICVDVNLYKAVGYYQKGADLDDPKSQYKLGCMYRDGISVESDWHWEIKSTTEYVSDKDNVIREYWDTQKSTTVCVYREKVIDHKILIPQDITKAKYWWKKAEAQGYAEASDCLQKVYD